MNENNIGNEIDEFWRDCLKDSKKSQMNNKSILDGYFTNINNNSIKKYKKKDISKNYFKNKRKMTNKGKPTNIKININNEDFSHIKSKINSITQSSPYNRKNIREVLIKEELIPIIQKKKEDKYIQKCINIYNKDKANKALRTKLNNTQKIKYEKKMLEECTFKPIKSPNKKLSKKIEHLYNNSNIYDRNIKLRQKYHQKIALLYNEENKMNKIYANSACIFHPNLPNKNVNKNIFSENNIWKESADNDSNKLFLLRYMKARENEYDKKERLLSPINRSLKHSFPFKRKMIRTLSNKDSLLLKKDLHQKLYSYKSFLDDENQNTKHDKEKTEPDNINVDGIIKENLQWTFAKKTES
jgi:hypothetical protein